MIADLRNNQSFEWSMQVAHTCTESDWIQGSSMYSKSAIQNTKNQNKNKHFLYLKERLKINIFGRRVCDLRPSI